MRAFLDFLGREYGGRVEAMDAEEPWILRAKLLAVPGIGRETADSIALYAAGRPLFVIDAYTRRVFARLGADRRRRALRRRSSASSWTRCPREAPLFNEYHAQIVILAKDTCRPRPRCAACPLDDVCPQVGSGRPREPGARR